MDGILNLVVGAIILISAYFVGSAREKKHYASIKRRERRFQNLPMTGQKKFTIPVTETRLVFGNVVIAQDRFKATLAWLRGIVGGRMSSYETLIDRGRREATLRLKEQAQEWGATEVAHFRIETANISNGRGNQSNGTVEVMAYGTAGRA